MPTTVPVELYRTIERANAAAKAAATATAPGAAFGVRRLTAAGLVEELWELWGDGRVLVSAEERSLLAARTASTCDAAAASGAPSVLAAFAAEHAAALADEGAVPVAELTSLQRGLVACLRSYYDELAARNLIEADEAADLLASMVEDGRLPAMGVTVCDCLDVSGGLRHLLTALGASAEGDEALAAVSCLPEDVEPGVLIAAGAAAMPGLLLDEIGRAGRAGARSVLVVGADPAELFGVLGAPLCASGWAVALRGTAPWRATAFGRAWECARRLEEGSPHWLEAATDFAYNPFSGIAERKARDLNGRLRKDRLLTATDAAEILAGESDSFSALALAVRAVACGESVPPRILDALSSAVGAASSDALERAVERAAFDKLCGLLALAEGLGVSTCALTPLLADATLSVEGSSGTDGPLCEIAGAAVLDSLVPKSWDVVILADVSARTFGISESLSALDGLAETLGLPREPSALWRQRSRFAAAQRAARRRFVLGVSRRDERENELFPSFLLEEFASAQARAGVDRALAAGDEELALRWGRPDPARFGLPEPLAASARCAGEGDLPQALGAAFAPVTGCEELLRPSRGSLRSLPLLRYLQRTPEGLPVLSPSAIEQYLHCPYRWFVQSCIRPEAPDERFGPRELGNFAHEAFARFYDRLAEEGVRRVDAENIEAMVPRFEALVNELVREQPERRGGSRLAATTREERQRVAQLKRQLVHSLRLQAQMPPGYEVVFCEHPIEVADGVDFAGVRLRGRVDRVDADAERGRFVVIDYKGSSKDYASGLKEGDEPSVPHHVQGLIYAQALLRTDLGLACAGALYLGYRAQSPKELLAGAYDGAAFDPAGLSSRSSAVAMNFSAYLDAIEALVADRLAALSEGAIPVSPCRKLVNSVPPTIAPGGSRESRYLQRGPAPYHHHLRPPPHGRRRRRLGKDLHPDEAHRLRAARRRGGARRSAIHRRGARHYLHREGRRGAARPHPRSSARGGACGGIAEGG